MLSVNPKFGMLPIFLYAYEMKRLQYWQARAQTSYTDALARYAAMASTERDKDALSNALLISIGKAAQLKRDTLIDSIDDSETLTAEDQEDIWTQLQDYQRIIFQVADILQGKDNDKPNASI